MFFWIFTILTAVVLFAPIRVGDLPGYDDSYHSMIAKDIVLHGTWTDTIANGVPLLEHPPLFPWMQALLFLKFGFSDFLAKLPAALCGFGVILLTYWLGRKLLGDSFGALLGMFVMAGTIYFLKYAARAMTDVPFVFFFLAAVCAWLLSEDDPRWYLACGLMVSLALLTRAMTGFSLPILFALDCLWTRRRPRLSYLIPALAIAILPLAAWYAMWIHRYGSEFFRVHSGFLSDKIYGPTTPAWRRYSGAPEYIWMIAKSYWPWLPFMLVGLMAAIRGKDRKLRLLILWVAVVFVLCAIARSRVLRYMLPAYPAFAIFSAIGLRRLASERFLRGALQIVTPLLAAFVIRLAVYPPVSLHASETRPIALAVTAATQADESFAFYDEGQRRWDEIDQIIWYGNRHLIPLFGQEKLIQELQNPEARVFVLDQEAYHTYIETRIPHRMIGTSGHLMCFRLD
jgi:4-amino-4-deoxy-L-arabinose transferase-like glycosyltransferase